jgi:hypothetical protein
MMADPLTYRYLVPESNETETDSARQRLAASPPDPGRPPKPHKPPKPPLGARRLLAAAAMIARGDPWRILAVSIAVSASSVLAETVAELVADPHNPWQAGIAAVITEAVGLLGTVALSGFLCRLTGQHGQEKVTLGQVIRTLPWGRLIAADLIVTAAVLLGLAALIIPGFIIGNLLAIVGPLIEIEDQPLRAALRRSAHLTRPYFWRVALLVTAPVLVLTGLESAGPEPSGGPEILEALAIRGVADGVLEAAFGLVLTQLCFRLISLDAGATRARRAAAAARS